MMAGRNEAAGDSPDTGRGSARCWRRASSADDGQHGVDGQKPIEACTDRSEPSSTASVVDQTTLRSTVQKSRSSAGDGRAIGARAAWQAQQECPGHPGHEQDLNQQPDHQDTRAVRRARLPAGDGRDHRVRFSIGQVRMERERADLAADAIGNRTVSGAAMPARAGWRGIGTG